MIMNVRLTCVAIVLGCLPAMAEELKLPKQVTPALRAVCETDVRRLCVGANPTVDAVKSCVVARFAELNKRCQFAIASAGLM